MAWYSGYQHPYQGFYWTWNNEKAHSGIDLPDSCGTPMTAILPGTVIVAGQYPCYGGQVSIRSSFGGVPIVYTFLHGQSHNVSVGESVKPGQLVGYSGAPISAGCGSGCHIHFEVEHGTQAPYTGGPPQNSSAQNYPINPVPLLAYAAGNKIAAGNPITNAANTLSNATNPAKSGSTTGTSGDTTLDTGVSGQQGATPGFDWASFFGNIGNAIGNITGVGTGIGALEANVANLAVWLGNPIRIAKLIVGVGLIGIALVVLILPTAAPLAAGGITAIAGAPEAAPAVAGAVSSVTHRRRPGEPRPTPPPASQTVPTAAISVQRSYTTRRLRRAQPTGGIGAPAPAPARAAPSAPVSPAPTPVATIITSPQGKRTMRTPIVAPTSGRPAPGVQRMVPATGPSIPSNPPRSRKVPAKPTASYTTPAPVQRAATTTTPLRAPTTQPLRTNIVPGTGMPMTQQEANAGRAGALASYRGLRPGQSAVGIPRSQRKQSQLSLEELRKIPTAQLTPASKRRLKSVQQQTHVSKVGDIDSILDQFRQARDG